MARKFWQIRNATEPGVGDLLIYGPIGSDNGMGWLFDDVTPKQFREDLDSLGAINELRVFINSPGGDVFAGQAIHSILMRHPASITVYVDGLAASIAAVVAMAGDRVIMPRNAMMMIHNPFTIGIGDSEEFRKLADTLDLIRESIVAAYESKTGMDRDELLPLLDAETWLTADDAVRMGFADEIEESKQIAASMLGPDRMMVNGQEIDLSGYRSRPKNLPQQNHNLSFDEHRAQALDIAKALVNRWQEIAKDLSASRRERLDADLTAWEDVTSSLRDLLPEAVSDSVNQVAIEYERLKAILNGVPA